MTATIQLVASNKTGEVIFDHTTFVDTGGWENHVFYKLNSEPFTWQYVYFDIAEISAYAGLDHDSTDANDIN